MALQRRMTIPLCLFFALTLITAGCSENRSTVPSVPGGPTADLNDPDGGLDRSDEAPGFGDEGLLRMAGEEASVEPGFAQDEVLDGAALYALAVLWGRYADENGEDGDIFDWSGSAVAQGDVQLRLTTAISFEHGDEILPRREPNRVDWISHTGQQGVDGIRLQILVKTVGPADSLTFTAGDYTRTFAIADLDSLVDVVFMEDINYAIRFYGTRMDTRLQKQGLLRGTWAHAEPGDSVGTLSGVWAPDFGHEIGYFRGNWGRNAEGEPVFFAKLTDREGTFRGMLRGIWEIRETGNSRREQGAFRGEWFDENEVRMGVAGGHWSTLPGHDSGPLAGRWCFGCELTGPGTRLF